MHDEPGIAFEDRVPKTIIDTTIFDDDTLSGVTACISYWQQGEHPGEERPCPFRRWPATGSPKDDLTWIAFGYNFDRHAYDGGYYVYNMDDNGMTIARAQQLLVAIDAFLLPDHAIHMHAIASRVLTLLTKELFPAPAMMAHQWRIDGEFTEIDGWIAPAYPEGSPLRLRPGQDFMDGVERVLRDLANSPQQLPPSSGDPVPGLFIFGQFDRNLQAVRDAFPQVLDPKYKFPNGLIPFWQHEIMHSYSLWSERIPWFCDEELSQ